MQQRGRSPSPARSSPGTQTMQSSPMGRSGPSPPSPLRSSTTPAQPVMEPSLTYDEAEMQRSRHFIRALQELKNLRPQLYSAAEYCESSYLHSNQKQAVLDNLKDYSIKALVNAVDHLGTVAFKLNDLLSQETMGISTAELRAASLAQRMRSCQEHSEREGLKQQSLAKTMPANHKHYILPDPFVEAVKRTPEHSKLLRETFDLSQVAPQRRPHLRPQSQPQPVPLPLPLYAVHTEGHSSTSGSRSLAWHFASDQATSSTNEGSKRSSSLSRRTAPLSSTAAQPSDTSRPQGSFLSSSYRNGHTSPTKKVGLSTTQVPTKFMASAKVSLTRSGSIAPMKTPPPAHSKTAPLTRSASLMPSSLTTNGTTKEIKPGPTRSKSLLRSLLGRRRTAKPTSSS